MAKYFLDARKPEAASGALTDLLGLESELTSIQAGMRSLEQMGASQLYGASGGHTQPAASQGQPDMIPVGSLQPSVGFPHQQVWTLKQLIALTYLFSFSQCTCGDIRQRH